MAGDAAFGSFRFFDGEAFSVPRPNQSYDFSQTFTNSDLDSERVEVGVRGSYRINEKVWLTGGYRVLDYDDQAPYLYDTSGSVDAYYLRLGWSF